MGALRVLLMTALLHFFIVFGRRDTSTALDALPGINFKHAQRKHVYTKPDKPTRNYQRISASRGPKNSRSAAAVLGAHQRNVGGHGYDNITVTTAFGTQYAIEILFNQQPMKVVIDTGSSDTWVVQRGFSCIDYVGDPVDPGTCGFGPPYQGDFQYGSIPHEHIYVQYGDGETIYGPMGYSDISVGGINVLKQEVALINTTYWFGNNVTSGLIGLAYPSLTNAYYGDGSQHDWIESVEYSPLFTTMTQDGLLEPYFSMAISRNSSGGLIGWGGIPPVTGLDYRKKATCDLIITDLISKPFTAWDYSFYTIIPDGFQWDQTVDTKKYPFIVDSGTTLMYLPPPLAEAINAAFSPPATYLWMYGAYFTSCKAIAPLFSVILDGVSFRINPVDLIFRNLVDPLTGLCMTGIASGGSGPYILGDVFMQNVLAIFDVGQAEMRFIGRSFY